MAEWSKASDLRSDLRKEAWVQTPLDAKRHREADDLKMVIFFSNRTKEQNEFRGLFENQKGRNVIQKQVTVKKSTVENTTTA